MQNTVRGEVYVLEVSGLFLSLRHEPTTKFLDGKLELQTNGYIVTKLGEGGDESGNMENEDERE